VYRRTDRQVSLLQPASALPEGARARLDASWADGFAREVLPLLLGKEDDFRELYCADNGRPNWSVARILGILILQEMQDLPDQAALDLLSFDLRWHRALGIDPGDAYLSRRSLVEFRARLVNADPDAVHMRGVFDDIVAAAMTRLQVSTREQRLDSTRIQSNIYTRGRLDLFSKTLRLFVRTLQTGHAAAFARLPEPVRAWFEKDEDGVFGQVSAEQARVRLEEVARWLVAVRDLFAGDEAIVELEAYGLVCRLIDDHLDVKPPPAEGEGSPAATDPGAPAAPVITLRKAAGSSLQSPFDPDAGCGHKGPGYHVQIAETCNNEQTELIVDFDVQPANVSDHGQAAASLGRLDERGLAPETMFVDAGYVSGPALADAEARNIDLHGPVNPGQLPGDAIGRDHWQLEPETGRLAVCPAGHLVLRHRERTNPNGERALHAYVDGEHCRGCPLLERCLARPPNSGKRAAFHIEDSPSLHHRDRRLTLQRDPEWRQRYRIRAGIEATNSELKRAHGLGRLRVRRAARVRLAVTAKLTACNVKRWLRARR
jgi:transposase